MVSMEVGVWIGALWIFLVYSFTLRDTPLFRFCEATMTGVATGVLTVIGVDNARKLAWLPLVEKGAYINLIPLVLGLLLFARISRRHAHFSRVPIAIMIGAGLGLGFTRNISSMVVGQLQGIMQPLPETPLGIFNTIMLLAGLIGTLLVFTYTAERKGPFGAATKIGQYLMMIAMGSNFGSLVTMRATYVVTRLQLVFYELLGLG